MQTIEEILYSLNNINSRDVEAILRAIEAAGYYREDFAEDGFAAAAAFTLPEGVALTDLQWRILKAAQANGRASLEHQRSSIYLLFLLLSAARCSASVSLSAA